MGEKNYNEAIDDAVWILGKEMVVLSLRNHLLLFNRPVIRRYFFRMLVSYLLVVLLASSILFPIMGAMRTKMLEERLATERNDSIAAIAVLSQQLETISNTALYLSSQKGFDRLSIIQGPISTSNYLHLTYARDFLNSIRRSNSLIDDIIVSFFDNEIVVTSNYAFDDRKDFEAFYPSESLRQAMNSFSPGFVFHWRSFSHPEFSLYQMLDAQDHQVIPFCVPLTTKGAYPMNLLGCVVVLLNRNQVADLLFSSSVQADGHYALLDQNGLQIIGNQPSNLTMPNHTYFDVTDSLFSLRVGLPEAAFQQYAQPMLSLVMRYTLFGLLLGIAAAFYSSIRATRPMQKVLEQLGGVDSLAQNKTAYQLILQSIDDMLQNINRLTDVSKIMAETQLSRRLDRLISGCDCEMEDLALIPAQGVLCYAQSIPFQDDAANSITLLNDYIRRVLPEKWIFHSLTGNNFLILIPCADEPQRKEAAHQLRMIFSETSGLFSISLSGIVSTRFERPDEISAAFENAKLLHYTMQDKMDDAVWLMETSPQGNGAFSMANQTELFHLLVAGKCDQACQKIETFFLEYQELGMEQIYYSLRMVLLMAMEQQNTYISLRQYRANVTPGENIDELLSAARQICLSVNQGKRSHNERLKEKILACIDQEFTDSELYNASLAERCGISEKYLCNFIKEQTGRTVTDLIQSKRVEFAYDLLLHSAKPINDIWQLSGFSSYNTFYKIIKRVYGLSPIELRANQEKQNT